MIGTEVNKRVVLWAASTFAAVGGLWGGIQLISDHMASTGWPLLLIGMAGLFMLFHTGYREFSQSREHWRQWQLRPPQSNEEFLSGCGFSPESADATLALAVRNALGETSGIPAPTIYAADSMRDSIWDSMVLLDVWFRTEKAAGVKIEKNWFDLACKRASGDSKLPPWRFVNDVLVKHIVTAIVESAGAPLGK